MIGGVAALFLLIVGGAILVTVLNQKDVDAPAAGESEYGVTIGDADAPHELVIYEDFVCPFCGELESRTHEELAALADDGKVFVDYRPFDLLSGGVGDYPIRAANAFAVVLDESGPDVAKKFHDLLYENQPSEQGPLPYTDDDLVDLAVEAGAEESDVRDDIEGLAMEDWVTDATKAADDAHVTSTPTVLLDGEELDRLLVRRRPRRQGSEGGPVSRLRDGFVAGLPEGRAARPPRRVRIAADGQRARGPPPRQGTGCRATWRSCAGSSSSATSATSSRSTSPSSTW